MQIDKETFEKVLLEVVDILIKKHIDLGMKASGKWINSLEVSIEDNKGIIKGIKYTEQLVFGRKPNQNQDPKAKIKWAYGMANFNPDFKKWLQIRGLSNYGVQVAYNIADEGTEYYKQGGTDLLEVLDSKEVTDLVWKKISSLITPQIEENLIRNLQTLAV